MAVNTIEPKLNTTSSTGANTDRGPSPQIWADCPVADIQENPSFGLHFFDDFLHFAPVAAGAQALYGSYYGFADTGGSVAVADEVGGVITFSSDGDNEGASIQTPQKFVQISRSYKKLWFEARVKFSTIADTKNGFFVGLIDTATLSATVPITAAGAIADENVVGFHRLEGDGDMLDVVYKADGVTQVTLAADAVTLAADTYVKVGFVFEPTNSIGNYYVRFFYNGVEITGARYQIPSAAGTDFPNDVRLGLVAAVLNATGSSPGDVKMDWWRIAQLF